MNKHALFLYGDYRTFDWCHLWYANKIPENVDVYVSTYNTSYEQKRGEIQWNKKDETWNFVDLNPPPTPPIHHPDSSEYSITYSTQGIKREIFQTIFKNNLKDVHITNRDFNEWILDKDKVGTTHYIIRHLKRIVDKISIEKRCEYKNIYILRLDSIPVDSSMQPFTFDEKLFKNQFDLIENTLYSESEKDMMNWTFANDLVFSGRAKTIFNWIEYLDSEKHTSPHTHIANATGEMVKKGILKHETLANYSSLIVRRSMVPFFSYYWDKGIYPLDEDQGTRVFYKFQKTANNLEYRGH